MGAWDELDTEVSVDVDVTDIDDAIDFLNDESGIFEPAIEILEDFKKAIDEGSKRGVSEIATKIRSFQEQALGDLKQHPYSQGILETSIEDEELDDGYVHLIGTIISHFYPLCVEFGRDEVVASPGKSLAFYALSGELVFAKRVSAAEPRPFVAPAYDKADEIAEDLMLIEINHALNY